MSSKCVTYGVYLPSIKSFCRPYRLFDHVLPPSVLCSSASLRGTSALAVSSASVWRDTYRHDVFLSALVSLTDGPVYIVGFLPSGRFRVCTRPVSERERERFSSDRRQGYVQGCLPVSLEKTNACFFLSVGLQALYTYEGTYDINMLVAGRAVTGVSALK